MDNEKSLKEQIRCIGSISCIGSLCSERFVILQRCSLSAINTVVTKPTKLMQLPTWVFHFISF